MKYWVLVMATAALGACVSAPPQSRPATPVDRPTTLPARPQVSGAGLQAVMGKDVSALKRMFGEPRLDVVEVYGRKLQFTGTACVLDAYLYPDGPGKTEVVTHIDARRSDGAEVDRAACVNALMRR